MIIYALGKSGISYESIMFHLHAGFVNQLMACYWMDQGIEIESDGSQNEKAESILERINKVRKRKRPKFKF